jgi:hypothetical protein
MKRFIFPLLIFLIVACDPFDFGFKHNPAYVLDRAFNSIQNLDNESFLEISGKEALCLYGSSNGLIHLKNKIEQDISELKPVAKLINSKRNTSAEFVGYWSYYTERYQVLISENRSEEEVLEIIIDCYYGTDSEKDDKFKELKPKEYPKKECRLVKIIPKKFKALEISSRCKMFEVKL